MAVISVRKLWQDRAGKANAKGVRRYTESWRVETNNKNEGAVTVGAGFTLSTGIGYGSTYHEDSGAWLQDLDPRQEKFSPTVWIVTCSYSSERETATDPTTEPAIITWGGEQFQKPAVFDRNGDAIVNSAGDFFEDPPQMDDSRITAQIQKNVEAVPSWLLDYRDSVNSGIFMLDGIAIGIGVAKLQPPTIGQEQVRNGYVFRQLTLNMHFRDEGWAVRPLDQGYHEIGDLITPGDGEARVKMLNADGTEPSRPILLDGNGARLENPNPTNAVFLEFDVYKERDFSVLPLT